MQSQLVQLNGVPGVVGSMVCDAEGRVLAQAFPPQFDATMLHDAAAILANGTVGLESATGPVGMMDLRYGAARLIVKPIGGGHVLVLCTPSVNLQLLVIAISAAVPRLEKVFTAGAPAPARGARVDAARASPTGEPSRLFEAVQQIEQIIAKKNLPVFKTKGEISLKAGFALALIDGATPDDPEKLAKLKSAVKQVLHENI